MKGWGGENLDLSLRIWRCGGEIVSANRSYVGHMWRDGKHAAKYTVQAGDVPKNLATAMMGHAEDFGFALSLENGARIYKGLC